MCVMSLYSVNNKIIAKPCNVMFGITIVNILFGDSCVTNLKCGVQPAGWNIVYHISKVSEIVLILKPADDIATSNGEKSYCHFIDIFTSQGICVILVIFFRDYM